jgi:hypothetical protein
MIPTQPPFTPQQRIDNDFENYPSALLGSQMIKALQGTPTAKPGGSVGWNPVAMNDRFGPSPFLDIDKYTPKPLNPVQPSDPALKFWEHPSPIRIPIREGLFGVPPEHLQQMAGELIRPSIGWDNPWPAPGLSTNELFERAGQGGWLRASPDAWAEALGKGKAIPLPRK